MMLGTRSSNSMATNGKAALSKSVKTDSLAPLREVVVLVVVSAAVEASAEATAAAAAADMAVVVDLEEAVEAMAEAAMEDEEDMAAAAAAAEEEVLLVVSMPEPRPRMPIFRPTRSQTMLPRAESEAPSSTSAM
jgi:hypothetical protein